MKISSVPSMEMLNKYVHVRDRASIAYTPTPSYDRVEIGGKAQAFSTVFKAVKEMAMERTPAEQQRIEDIAERIQNNTYDISGRSVADRMLEK